MSCDYMEIKILHTVNKKMDVFRQSVANGGVIPSSAQLRGEYLPKVAEYHKQEIMELGHDEEAVVDLGKTSSTISTNFEKEELESHRAVYIGVHVPLGKESRRRHRHRGHRHQRKRRHRDSDREDGRDSPTYDTPSQRVQFILGTEDDDEEHISHDLFTEMDELSFREDTPSQRVQFILGTEDDDEEHISHDLFTEMDELSFREGHEYEWKETARWLKFEEDVEDGGERWSKPYVATLSLHSLFELRSCILKGTVMLDMRANSIEEIADMVIDNMIVSEQLDESVREKVRGALLKRHHHQNEKKLSNRIPLVRSFADIGKKQSDPHLLERNGSRSATPQASPKNTPPSTPTLESHHPLNVFHEPEVTRVIPIVVVYPPEEDLLPAEGQGQEDHHLEQPQPGKCLVLHNLQGVSDDGHLASPQSAPGNLETAKGSESKGSMAGGSRENSTVDFSKVDMNFMKKIPPGAEASNILVGEVDFLERPIIAFIRLAPAVLLTGLTEVPVPTRLFGGLVLDIKRKKPFFLSDIKDSLNLQCLASILFLYCACMSPVITFGGLLGEATKGNISAIESLFGASLTGISYSLFAGQPLTILGSTGPVLVFEKILFQFCVDYELSYLSLRTSIGLWTAFFCIVLVATDASSLVCYITRFTEEAFAALICIIFIYEALEKLFHLGELYPVNMHNDLDNLTFYTCQCSKPANLSSETLQRLQNSSMTLESIQWEDLDVTMCKALHGEFVGLACEDQHHGPYIPDVLFWSIILFFTTLFLSSFLKQFKTMRYFPTKVRSTISDFAVFLTILIMVVVDYLIGIPSPKLNVPDRFEPTSKNRGWLIDPLGPNPWWTLLAAAIPALLCTILIFMDQQITGVIINRKEHKLKKGCGYHLDLLLVAVMLGICSTMGLPWFVAATVLSISHVNSLKVESECSAPGEQPKFLGIREQRITGLMIFVLMGLSVFMTSVLKFIPMPVLYGVFLYMGASSLKGIQFFDRIKLFGMPAKHQPDLIYLRYVPLWKVHVFTIIQLTCLVLLWVIKVSSAAVVFPMMVLALVFIRKLLDFFFTNRELSWLDDLMPESKKKKEDDKKKKEKEKAEQLLTVDETMQIPFEGGNLLKIPVKSLKCSSDPSVVNISDEMAKTAVWKAVAMPADNAKAMKPSSSLNYLGTFIKAAPLRALYASDVISAPGR
ncbi:UNVERIFIED_CONTAM: hypothetical protein FKN15_014600 [Acipenser sinensis]